MTKFAALGIVLALGMMGSARGAGSLGDAYGGQAAGLRAVGRGGPGPTAPIGARGAAAGVGVRVRGGDEAPGAAGVAAEHPPWALLAAAAALIALSGAAALSLTRRVGREAARRP